MLPMMTAFLLLAATASAQDAGKPLPADHPATKRWDQSKETYFHAIEGHKKAFLKFMQGVEDRARTAGDAEAVKKIMAERVVFEKSGVLPKSVKTVAYEKDLATARSVLSKEATTAKAAFLTARLDDAAATVDKESKAILGNPEQKNVDKPVVDARGEWKAAEAPNRWVHNGGKDWREFGGVGANGRVWTEQSRSKKMVELKFGEEASWIRFYRDHAEVKYGNGVFGNWGPGKWVVEPNVEK